MKIGLVVLLIAGIYLLLAHCEGEAINIDASMISFRENIPAGEITITSIPSPLNVVLGTTFGLTCNYNPHTFLSWIHPTRGEVVASTGNITLTVTSFAKFATLIVLGATRDDEGEYICRVMAESSAILTQNLNASLFERVQITTPSMLTYQAALCETVSLNCTALHHDFVIWRKVDGRTITNSSDGRFIVLHDQLVIHGARITDNGTYTCSAFNTADSAYIIAYLHIGNQY